LFLVNHLTGIVRSKGYGFVRFGEEGERARSMTKMNGIYCVLLDLCESVHPHQGSLQGFNNSIPEEVCWDSLSAAYNFMFVLFG